MKYFKNKFTVAWMVCLIIVIAISFVPNKYSIERAEQCIVMDKIQMTNGSEHAPHTALCLALKNDKGEICIVPVGDASYISTRVGQHVNYMLSDRDFKRKSNWLNFTFHEVIPIFLGCAIFILILLSLFSYTDDYYNDKFLKNAEKDIVDLCTYFNKLHDK